MFGRVRPSSSLDGLERPPSKIFKDDPLSIYETTLIKLKLGSQRDLSPLSEETVEMESDFTAATLSSSSILFPVTECSSCASINASESSDDSMVIDSGSSSTRILSCVGASQSTGDSKPERSKNASLLYLFSKYKTSRNRLNSTEGVLMTIASGGSATTSKNSSSCLSVGYAKQQCE